MKTRVIDMKNVFNFCRNGFVYYYIIIIIIIN